VTAIAVVIPVRDAAPLLPDCLGPILAQVRPGDEVVVVDDGSADDTAAVAAAAGARVLRQPSPAGPYTARNAGWRATPAPYVLFTDVRCVVRPGWLEHFRRAASGAPGLIFADVVVRGGSRLAERVAARRQHLLARHYADDPYFLPYFPTANLAVSRVALEAVGGFREMVSGGDADLCWRVQLAGFEDVRALDKPLMEWRPRLTVREFVQQWAKYGNSNAILRHTYADRGAAIEPPIAPLHVAARHVRRAVRRLRHERDSPVAVTVVDALADAAHELTYGRTMRRLLAEDGQGG
jgi:glycosyltransferase involved in cell wall biosynthesis